MHSQTVIEEKKYGYIKGTLCLIGYGSIGQGLIPLIQRHLTYDRLVIIDPCSQPKQNICDEYLKVQLTKQNYIQIFDRIFQNGGFCVHVAIGTSSKDIIEYCQRNQVLYIDAMNEEWLSDFDQNGSFENRTLYKLRHHLLENVQKTKYESTAVSCCGANPGLVSWLVKQGVINIAKDTYGKIEQPKTREEWSLLMKNLGVKGIHVAERDLQIVKDVRPVNHFWSTWSVEGYIHEVFHQGSEIGWGSHEKKMPRYGKEFTFGSKYAIYIGQPSYKNTIKSWCPTPGPQVAYVVPHDQALSISEYYKEVKDGKVVYQPTACYAYHPSEISINSTMDMIATEEDPPKQNWKIPMEQIVDGTDELGVFIYGHEKNAYWFGSQLSIQDTRKRITSQNATSLQVTSAVFAGMVWALENPKAGFVEADQMDHKRCLEVAEPYIAPLNGYYTDWNPLKGKSVETTEEEYDWEDPWQFTNLIIHK